MKMIHLETLNLVFLQNCPWFFFRADKCVYAILLLPSRWNSGFVEHVSKSFFTFFCKSWCHFIARQAYVLFICHLNHSFKSGNTSFFFFLQDCMISFLFTISTFFRMQIRSDISFKCLKESCQLSTFWPILTKEKWGENILIFLKKCRFKLVHFDNCDPVQNHFWRKFFI